MSATAGIVNIFFGNRKAFSKGAQWSGRSPVNTLRVRRGQHHGDFTSARVFVIGQLLGKGRRYAHHWRDFFVFSKFSALGSLRKRAIGAHLYYSSYLLSNLWVSKLSFQFNELREPEQL